MRHWEFLDFSSSEKQEKPKINQPIKEGWEAVCSHCGKSIIVPFRPDPNRPVYCEDCLKEMKKTTSFRKEKPPPKTEEIKKIIKGIFK